MIRPAGERWARVKELFEAVIDLDPTRRATLLEKECGGDEALRAAIEYILDSAQQPEGVINQTAFAFPRHTFHATS